MASDASGRAEFMSRHGAEYKVTIESLGFRAWAETFKVESNIAKTVTLTLANTGPGLSIESEGERILPNNPLVSTRWYIR